MRAVRPAPAVEAPVAAGAGELRCEECGAVSVDGGGWRTELAPDYDGGDELVLAVYCPRCWRDEFGAAADEG